MADQTEDQPGPNNKVRLIAITLVSLLLLGALLSTAVPGLQICRDRLATTGGTGVVRVCEPLFSEVGILGLAILLVVLVLLPILAKFDVAGLVSVEMKADAAKKDAEEARTLAEAVSRHAIELDKVQRELADIQERLLARLVTDPTSATWTRLVRDLAAGPAGRADELAPSRGKGIERLLRGATELLRYEGIGPSGRAQDVAETPIAVTAAGRKAVEDWRRRYRLELAQVRAVRNRVAHGEETDSAEIVRAADLADQLLKEVRKAISEVE